MTEWKERGEALTERARTEPGAIVDGTLFADTLALINERLDAEGLRGKVWLSMRYRCDSCGDERLHECEVGIEGPDRWREDSTYVASPYAAGRCEECGGTMTHTDFTSDQKFEPREPSVSWVFRVPREPVRYPTLGCNANGDVIYSTGQAAFLSYHLSPVPA